MGSETLYADIFMRPNSLQVCFESWITNDKCDNWVVTAL